MIRTEVYTAVMNMAAVYGDTGYTGIMAEKGKLTLYSHNAGMLSVYTTACKSEIPNSLVFTSALKAAVSQTKGPDIDININPDGQAIKIGRAELTVRDGLDLPAILKSFHTQAKLNKLPDLVCKLITTTFATTYVNSKPKSVFGWELRVHDGIARFGSASAPYACWGEAEIDIDDMELRIPEDTCAVIHKVLPLAVNILMGSQVLQFDQGSVTHYATITGDTPSIGIKDVVNLLKTEVSSITPTELKTQVTNLLHFADADSSIMFYVKDGQMTADVSGRTGRNRVDITHFDKSVAMNFQIKPSQLANAVTSKPVTVSIAMRDGRPNILVFTEAQKEKKKEVLTVLNIIRMMAVH